MRDTFVKSVIIFTCIASISILGLMIYSAFADTSHTSIVLSESCRLSHTCLDYDDLLPFFPQPVFLYGNDHIEYENFRRACIDHDICNYFSGIKNNTIWFDVVDHDAHTLTLVPSPFISHMSTLTVAEEKEIKLTLKENQENYDKHLYEIHTIEADIETHRKLIESNIQESRKLKADVEHLKQEIQHNESKRYGLSSAESQLIDHYISDLRSEISLNLEAIDLLKHDIHNYKLTIQHLRSDLSYLRDDLRYFSNTLRENQKQLFPSPLDNESRFLRYNTYSFYVDPACSYSVFYPLDVASVLKITAFVSGGCLDSSLLADMQLDYSMQLRTTEIPITDSENWQYLQWMKNITASFRNDE